MYQVGGLDCRPGPLRVKIFDFHKRGAKSDESDPSSRAVLDEPCAAPPAGRPKVESRLDKTPHSRRPATEPQTPLVSLKADKYPRLLSNVGGKVGQQKNCVLQRAQVLKRSVFGAAERAQVLKRSVFGAAERAEVLKRSVFGAR